MMEFYTPKTDELVRLHRQDLLRDAAQYRLLQEGKPARPSLVETLRTRMGGFLIAVGEKLQEPYVIHNSHPAQAC